MNHCSDGHGLILFEVDSIAGDGACPLCEVQAERDALLEKLAASIATASEERR